MTTPNPTSAPSNSGPTANCRAEQTLFRTLNLVVEPFLRSGLGCSLAGPGVDLVETTGRRSGQPRRVPLVGQRLSDTIVVSTLRENSQWVRNLEARPIAQVWVGGHRRRVTAKVHRHRDVTVATLQLHRS